VEKPAGLDTLCKASILLSKQRPHLCLIVARMLDCILMLLSVFLASGQAKPDLVEPYYDLTRARFNDLGNISERRIDQPQNTVYMEEIQRVLNYAASLVSEKILRAVFLSSCGAIARTSVPAFRSWADKQPALAEYFMAYETICEADLPKRSTMKESLENAIVLNAPLCTDEALREAPYLKELNPQLANLVFETIFGDELL